MVKKVEKSGIENMAFLVSILASLKTAEMALEISSLERIKLLFSKDRKGFS